MRRLSALVLAAVIGTMFNTPPANATTVCFVTVDSSGVWIDSFSVGEVLECLTRRG